MISRKEKRVEQEHPVTFCSRTRSPQRIEWAPVPMTHTYPPLALADEAAGAEAVHRGGV